MAKQRLGKPYRPREDAEERFQSILVAVRAICVMPDVVRPSHKKRLLNCCLWQLTQSQSHGKYNLRFATEAAEKLLQSGKIKQLRHEHVYTRKRMIDDLLAAHPDQIKNILEKACSCLVTIEEHQRLSDFRRQSPTVGKGTNAPKSSGKIA